MMLNSIILIPKVG